MINQQLYSTALAITISELNRLPSYIVLTDKQILKKIHDKYNSLIRVNKELEDEEGIIC